MTGSTCCRLRFPTIPLKWLLFIDFAFTFGTTVVYFADIVTDIITLKTYYDRGWYHAFGFSIGFIVAPSILLAILECQFLIKTYGKNIKWITVIVSTVLNIPFQLTVIWYHCKLSYKYLKAWLDNIRQKKQQPINEGDRKPSVSNLADIDDRLHTMERSAVSSREVPVSADHLSPSGGQADHTWWKQLTREEWLSHLNKMKLIESMLESLPQLLINLYLIVSYSDTPVIQYISASLSYISLCGGIVRFDKTRKDNEADRLMVDRTLLHSRAFSTRLEWPQLLFVSLYKGCFLAARILVIVYFTVYFTWYILVFIFVHWAVIICYLVYLWYPTDLNKRTRQLVQADYKFRAYMFLSQDFFTVLINSLVGIFISVRPQSYGFLGQPYCYLFWFYFAYIIENIVLFLLPGVFYSIRNEEVKLLEYQYYIILIIELTLNVFGAILCCIYYFSFHKMSTYTRNAYPQITKAQNICCCKALGPPVPNGWTVCKQAETSEIFFLQKEKQKEYKSSYNTVVRGNRKSGRRLECFIDDHGEIFYAPRNKLYKKLPSEEEEWVEIQGATSRQSLNDVDRETPSVRAESRSTAINERLVGERESSSFLDHNETDQLLSSAPPLPNVPPQASTPYDKLSENVRESVRTNKSTKSITKVDGDPQLFVPQEISAIQPLDKTPRESIRSTKSHRSNRSASKATLDTKVNKQLEADDTMHPRQSKTSSATSLMAEAVNSPLSTHSIQEKPDGKELSKNESPKPSNSGKKDVDDGQSSQHRHSSRKKLIQKNKDKQISPNASEKQSEQQHYKKPDSSRRSPGSSRSHSSRSHRQRSGDEPQKSTDSRENSGRGKSSRSHRQDSGDGPKTTDSGENSGRQRSSRSRKESGRSSRSSHKARDDEKSPSHKERNMENPVGDGWV